MDFKHNKSLGQNFIKDPIIIDTIVNNSNINNDTLVIEVGPGLGVLSEKIIPLSKHTILYEIDCRLENILNHKLVNNNNYELIINDFMKVDLKSKISNYKYNSLYFISNLPYYITTPIINKLINEEILPDKIIIMLQKEVADRFNAKINTTEYGSITVLLNTYYDISKLMDVDKKFFYPMPKVDSSIIIMNRNNNVNKIKNINVFNKLVRDSFQYKRKNIRNNLKKYNLSIIDNVLKKYDLSLNSRAENLSLDIFIELANTIS